MADAERPPVFSWSDDAGSDGDRAGSGGQAAGEHADDWPFGDTDEWTDPMGRAGTDPFDTPVGVACEQPDERARGARASRVPVAPGGVAARAGVVAGLASVVAMAAGLVLIVLEPRAPRESEQPREPRWFPISELSDSGAMSVSDELAGMSALTPLDSGAMSVSDELAGMSALAPADSGAMSVSDELAGMSALALAPAAAAADAADAICEPGDAPEPALPAAAPEPAQDEATARDAAGAEDHDAATNEPQPSERTSEKPDDRSGDADDDFANQRLGVPGVKTPAP